MKVVTVQGSKFQARMKVVTVQGDFGNNCFFGCHSCAGYELSRLILEMKVYV